MATPLSLMVQPVGRTSNTAPVMLRDIVEVRLANVSDVARTLRWPTADTLKIEVRGDMTQRVVGTWEPGDEKSGFSIDAGSEITLVGAGRINSEMEFAFLEPLHGKVQLRATLRPYQARQQVRVVSDWIDLELD
ncbi:MAG: hypothetical protein JKY37_31155 [Nannocystaceae bacterium]|nr:hypothetical protein [Nannocystaceae bacterium]